MRCQGGDLESIQQASAAALGKPGESWVYSGKSKQSSSRSSADFPS
jgi:hypothetical protein